MGNEIRDLRGGFTLIENDIIDDYENFTMHEVMAYMVLCRHSSNETNKCFPSYNTIAKKMRVSRPTAIKAINGLILKNVVSVEKIKKENGDNESNLYTIIGHRNKKAPTVPPVEADTTNKNIKPKSSICNNKDNNTSKRENKEEKNVSEVEKLIEDSWINIRKEDIKKCVETFTDIDKLKEAIKVVEEKGSHGFKVLAQAYENIGKPQQDNSKNKFHNFDTKGTKGLSEMEILNRNKSKYVEKIEVVNNFAPKPVGHEFE